LLNEAIRVTFGKSLFPEVLPVRKILGSLLLLVLLFAACAPRETDYLRAVLQFADAQPTVLLVSLPDHLNLVTVHPTLAGPVETQLETTAVPLDLRELGPLWADRMPRTLNFFRDVRFVASAPAGDLVRRLATDPRRAGRPGYRLLEPYRPAPPARDQLAAPPPAEVDLDDPRAELCLLRVEVPVNHLPTPCWRALSPERIAENFHADLLLLIGLDHLTVFNTGERPKVHYQMSAALVDLRKPLLAASFALPLDGNRVGGPGGVEAALCKNIDELRAADWQALRQMLAPLGERYGYLLATQMGWIGEGRLAEQAVLWQKENEQALQRLRGE